MRLKETFPCGHTRELDIGHIAALFPDATLSFNGRCPYCKPEQEPRKDSREGLKVPEPR